MILMAATLVGQAGIGPIECHRPRADDLRPYTLCLAEATSNEVEQRLRQQLKAALAQVRASKGAAVASRLRIDQRRWDQQRNRSCVAEAAQAPMPEQARANLTCLTMASESRTAHLTAIANAD